MADSRKEKEEILTDFPDVSKPTGSPDVKSWAEKEEILTDFSDVSKPTSSPDVKSWAEKGRNPKKE